MTRPARHAERLSDRYAREVRPHLTAARVFEGIAWHTQRDHEWRGPCPLHGGDGPNFSVKPDTLEWFCHSGPCKGGREVEYVRARHGLKDYVEAVRFLADLAGVELEKGQARRAARPRRPAPPPPAPRPRTYSRPPADEVWAVWRAAQPVTTDEAAAAYLRSRALDPDAVAAQDLARVLPLGAKLPGWAEHWRGGEARGYRLIFRVFGATGKLENLRARPLYRREDFKAFPGKGNQAGTVLANLLGMALLEGYASASEVWICEGEPDFLAVATSWPAEAAPAVLGIGEGWWTPELAARIPDGSTVVLATDVDGKGEGYAQGVVATLAARARAGRVTLRRW